MKEQERETKKEKQVERTSDVHMFVWGIKADTVNGAGTALNCFCQIASYIAFMSLS